MIATIKRHVVGMEPTTTYLCGALMTVSCEGPMLTISIGGDPGTHTFDRNYTEVFIMSDQGKTIDRYSRIESNTGPTDPLGRYRDPNDPLYQGAAVETQPASDRQAPTARATAKEVDVKIDAILDDSHSAAEREARRILNDKK